MGILRKLIQWREKSDGTLEGPALSTESVDSEEYLQDGEPFDPDSWASDEVEIDDEPVFLSTRTIASTHPPIVIEENEDDLPGGPLRDADVYIQLEEGDE